MFNVPEGGEAIIIKSKDKAILIDGGGGDGTTNEKLGKVIRKFLTGTNTKLDAIVASHNHEDHLNAIVPMLEGGRGAILKDDAVFYHNGEENGEFYEILIEKLKTERIDVLEFGNWTLDYIEEWNDKQDIAMFTAKVSDSKKHYRSIVMHVPYGDASFLFTGDIYKPYENRLIADPDFFRYIKTDVLKIALSDLLRDLAADLKDAPNFLYLGRGFQFPVALEGALKLKEVSYIHAEGYPAAEMKHGPIALIDENMPVVVLAPKDPVFSKVVTNIEEVKARDGKVIAVVTEGAEELVKKVDHVIRVPHTIPQLLPVLTTIPLQLLAYHIAVLRGCDVDQPRNLAKSVTVE